MTALVLIVLWLLTMGALEDSGVLTSEAVDQIPGVVLWLVGVAALFLDLTKGWTVRVKKDDEK